MKIFTKATKVDNRIDWQKYFVSLAVLAGMRSADPYRKVGAVCVSRENRILSCGYNGVAAGYENPQNFYSVRENPDRYDFTIHAEQNALVSCKIGDVNSIAITCSPCKACANIIAGYGIKNVLFAYEYPKEQGYKRIFDFYGIKYEMLKIDGIFSNQVLDIMQIPSISD